MEYTDKDLDRFWAKVDKTEDCWNWTSQLRGGYGIFRLNGKTVSAHRLSFVLVNGDTDKIIRHTCDNRSCVKPDHLVEGNHSQNTGDMLERDRHRGLLRNSQVEEIRQMPMSRTIVADVAKLYGISEHIARNILDGATFSHLPGARKIVRQKTRGKLTVGQIQEIKDDLRSPYWGQVSHLAKKYGVTHSQISHIKSGYIHSDVPISDTQSN